MGIVQACFSEMCVKSVKIVMATLYTVLYEHEIDDSAHDNGAEYEAKGMK